MYPVVFFFLFTCQCVYKTCSQNKWKIFSKVEDLECRVMGRKYLNLLQTLTMVLATKVKFKARSDTQIPARLAFPWKVGNKFTVFVICTFKFAIPMFVYCR